MPGSDYPLYLQPNGDDTHDVLIGNKIAKVSTASLTPQLVVQAHDVMAQPRVRPGENPYLANGPLPPTNDAPPAPLPLSPEDRYSAALQAEDQRRSRLAPPVEQPAPQTGGASSGWEPDPNAPAPKPEQVAGRAAANEVGPTPLGQPPPAAPAKPAGGGGPLGELNAAQNLKEKSIREEGKLQEETAKDKIAGINALQAQEAPEMQAFNIKNAAIQRQAEDMLSKGVAAADRFAQSTIDPNSMWNNKSTGQKIQAGLGMLLSGIGSGIGGGPNLAVKAIDEAQDRDLAAQRYNMDHNKEVSEQYRNLHNDFVKAGLDNKTAHDATMAAFKYKQDQENDKVAFAHGGESARQYVDAQTADSRQKKALSAADIITKALQNVGQRQANELGAINLGQEKLLISGQSKLYGGGAGGQGGSGWDALTADEKAAKAIQAQRDGTWINGIGIAQRKPEPEERASLQAMGDINKARADLNFIVNSPGYMLSPEKHEQAKQIATRIRAALPAALGTQAKLSEGSQNVLDNVMSDPKFDLMRHHAGLDAELGRLLDQKRQTLLHGEGGLGVTETGGAPSTANRDAALGVVNRG